MGLNVACVIALQFILLPIMRLIAYLSPFSLPQNWTAEFVSSAVGIISILPFFVITRLVNALWFSDIANASLKYRGLQSAVPISFRSVFPVQFFTQGSISNYETDPVG